MKTRMSQYVTRSKRINGWDSSRVLCSISHTDTTQLIVVKFSTLV